MQEIKELNMEALREEIIRKCKKGQEYLISRIGARDDEDRVEGFIQEEEEEMLPSITDEITEEELPFEEVLAEKRRKHTAKEEFIYSLYNDILPAFVAEWDGYFLRERRLARKLSKDDVEVTEESDEVNYYRRNDDLPIKGDGERIDKTFVPPCKLSLPDEFADVKFYNNNSYSGRISRKMMEGEGIYTWHNGVRYKGEFEQNQIQGRGLLEWSDDRWYEGDFLDGLRHGDGVMVDRERDRTYIGQWYMGHKHGKK